MSIFTRLLGKTPPSTAMPAAEGSAVPAESEPPPDPAVQARAEESLVAQAIAAGDMAAVGQWVQAGHSTRIRQLAARAISDLDQLHELIRATRHGKDKQVYRILTASRDELLEGIRRAEQLQADIDSAAAALIEHCGRAQGRVVRSRPGAARGPLERARCAGNAGPAARGVAAAGNRAAGA
jgi:hypothetical protein